MIILMESILGEPDHARSPQRIANAMDEGWGSSPTIGTTLNATLLHNNHPSPRLVLDVHGCTPTTNINLGMALVLDEASVASYLYHKVTKLSTTGSSTSPSSSTGSVPGLVIVPLSATSTSVGHAGRAMLRHGPRTILEKLRCMQLVPEH